MTSGAWSTTGARTAARAATVVAAAFVATLSYGVAGATTPTYIAAVHQPGPAAGTLMPGLKTKTKCHSHGKHGALGAPCPTPEVSIKPSWSGYVITESEVGEPITSVTGYWWFSHGDDVSMWIGIDGILPDDNLLQTGVGSGHPWWQELPQQGQQQNIDQFQQAGDEMYASLTRPCNTSDTWTITLIDLTQSWTWTKTVTYTGPALMADWIVEAPQSSGFLGIGGGQETLSNYGTTYFTHLTVNGQSPHLGSDEALVMNQGSGPVSTPSAPNVAGDAFGVSYGATPPSTPPNQLGYNGWGETFQPVGQDGTLWSKTGADGIYVLGSNRTLWLDVPPWDSYPPHRSYIDTCVRAFQALSLTSALVLGLDNNLWLETSPFGPAHRTWVDGNVEAFQMTDASTIFVLGTDGRLWEETAPFGPGHRTLVAGGATGVDGEYGVLAVSSFQAISDSQVLVLYNGGYGG
ncbi:MAG TPA: G1 family glutamic endopeptidase, partial [Acidimicrobiales bacterium]|nr:G1 family glutamic endopeptidase [Acidimicrobiales bacterium]